MFFVSAKLYKQQTNKQTQLQTQTNINE